MNGEPETLVKIGDDLLPGAVSPNDRVFREAWQVDGDVIVHDPELMKPIAISMVNEWRDREDAKPISFGGKTYSADPISIRNIMGAAQMAMLAQMAGQSYEVEWSLHDDTAQVLDASGIIGLGQAVGMRTNQIYVAARDKKATIDAATTEQEVRDVIATIE